VPESPAGHPRSDTTHTLRAKAARTRTAAPCTSAGYPRLVGPAENSASGIAEQSGAVGTKPNEFPRRSAGSADDLNQPQTASSAALNPRPGRRTQRLASRRRGCGRPPRGRRRRAPRGRVPECAAVLVRSNGFIKYPFRSQTRGWTETGKVTRVAQRLRFRG
jgi:hypothetical protein